MSTPTILTAAFLRLLFYSAAFSALAGTGTCLAGEPPSVGPVRRMIPAEKVSFPVPPPTAVLSRTKCDADGNVFVVESNVPPNLLDPRSLSGVPVLKLSTNSKSTFAYPVPSLDGYRGVIRSDFDINGGKVYALLEAIDASAGKDARLSTLLAKYADDGSVDSYVKLGDPPAGRLQPSQMIVFRAGSLLVTGKLVQANGSLRPVAAIFNGSSGQFVSLVTLKDYGEVAGVPESPSAPQKEPVREGSLSLSNGTVLAGGADGNVYALVGETHPRVYVISPTGDVIREFSVPVPAPGLAASNMGAAGTAGLFVSFGFVHGISPESSKSNEATDFVSFVNGQTGETTAVYELLNEEGLSMPACADSPGSFLFLGSTPDQQRQQITRFTAK